MLEGPYMRNLPQLKDAQTVSVIQKYHLKCKSCDWTTSYTDISGQLDIGGKQVRCPSCRKGVVEVEVDERHFGSNSLNVPRSYLEFILTDW
jgi:predicted Zn finger-like uncharacterized protein